VSENREVATWGAVTPSGISRAPVHSAPAGKMRTTFRTVSVKTTSSGLTWPTEGFM
jgi:hypothetical protein